MNIFAYFHVCISHLHFLFGKMSFQFFYPFFNQVVFVMLNCMSCLYMLDINSYLLYHLQIVAFLCYAKASKFNQVPCVYFCFYFVWETEPKKYCCNLCERGFCLVFLQEFYGISFTFMSLIHFEFIFVYGIIACSIFVLLHVAVQYSQNDLLKRLSFLCCIFLFPLSPIKIDHNFVSLYLDTLVCSIDQCVSFCGYYTGFDYNCSVIQSEVREHDFPSSVLFTQ